MRKVILSIFLCLFAAAPALSAAQPPARKAVSIKPQSLASALEALGKDHQLQILYRTEVIGNVRTEGVSGDLTFDEALRALLKNTGLTSKYVDKQTVTIVRGPLTSDASAAPADQMRLAGVAAHDGEQAGDPKDAKESAQVTVEGTRDRPAPFSTNNLDLTRTEDDVLPFTVFTARDIETSGAASLQEFFQNRLPQNFNADISTELDGVGVDQTSQLDRVDMRGWGASETVFLLNGRRMPAQYQGTGDDRSLATPNLQGIPMGAIERIEILPSAGSAIYGESATGGVINIITRQDFHGGQAGISYETPADANAPRRRVDFSYGMPLNWGFGLRISGGYTDSKPILAGERTGVTLERWRQLAAEREPSRLYNTVQGNPFRTTQNPPTGSTPNIRSAATTAGADLFTGLGAGHQVANFTTVPAGYDGSGGLAAFQPGVYNMGLAEGVGGSALNARGSRLGSFNDTTTFNLGLDRGFGENWRWSVDYRYSDRGGEGLPNGLLAFTSSNPTNTRPRVPAAAPANPFDQDVVVNLVDPRIAANDVNSKTNITWELASTLHGALGRWNGFLDIAYSQNRNRFSSRQFYEPYGGWRQAFLDDRYNPFVDVRTVAPAAPEFYETYIARQMYSGSGTRNFQSMIKASGPVWSLPAGELLLTAGVELSRADRHESFTYSQYQDAASGEPRIPVCCTSSDAFALDETPSRRFKFDDHAAYAEVNIPLLSSKQKVPLVERLELFGSARLNRTKRDGFGEETGEPSIYRTDATVRAFGLRYEVIEGMALRASRSVGFRPPGMEDVTVYTNEEAGWTNPIIVNDPLREDGVGSPGERVELDVTQFKVGFGNPDLKPETTTSTNIGLIFQPRQVPGLRVSVDYLESVRDDAIYGLSPSVAVLLNLPGRVVRGEPDGDPSGLGPVIFVDSSKINLNQVASKSVDFALEHRLDMKGGRLFLSLAATRNLSFTVQTNPRRAPIEQIRNINPDPATGNIAAFPQSIEWNGNGQVRWEGPQWSLGWSVRYYDYLLAVPEDYLLQGSDRAPRAFDHDLYVGFRNPAREAAGGMRGLLSGTSITFGVKNVFDREPRFWAADDNRGIAPYDSIMGRSVWMQMRKDF